MKTRRIDCIESDDKRRPAGMQWQGAYRRHTGSPLAGSPEYLVRWERPHMAYGSSACDTLTQARREARALVAEGRAWAEVFRYAENGVSVRAVLICSYEVATECGSEVA